MFTARKKLRCMLVVGIALSLLAAVGSQSVSAQTSNTFSGQATGVRATVLGVTTLLSDTGPLPASGDARETSLLTASVDGLLTAEVLHASTIGQGDQSRAEASVANVGLTVGGNTIAADFLMARAAAVCPTAVSGSSEIINLVINNGQPIVVSGQPNQTIPLPNGKVVINEQTSSVKGNTGDITVNALHIVVNGIADVVISSAHADITCTGQQVCTVGTDFVTGGGWIKAPSGGKGTFGVAGGIRNGAFWGHLTYIDHGTGMNMKVKGTGVTAYTVVAATTRHIEGTAEINGQGGFNYSVDVADNGEPGRNDTFALKLSNGYDTSTQWLDGGNIQLHQPKCK